MPCSIARRFASPFALVLIPLAASLSSAAFGASGENPRLGPPRHRVPLSAAYERMLRDQIAQGRVLSREIIDRFGLDAPETEPAFEGAAADQLRRLEGLPPQPIPAGPGQALAPDAQVNDKSGDVTCSTGCGNRPLGQAETTIAALGSFLLAGWNNTKGFCTGGAIQGYAYSVNAGATWVDAGDPPALPGGGRYRGDPVHAVNRSTGDFYILGLYEGGTLGSGVALARGHFSGGAFIIDDNRQIAVGGANFLDKEWMAVDPATGYLYVTYSNFVGGTTSQIELIRSTTNGATWDAPVVINSPATNDLVQGSRPAVGPGGEVYVVWYEFGAPQSHMRIRRSDNFGVSFGTEQTVCDFYENLFSGAPGFRRGFGIALPGIAVDNSDGPYRGRVYVTWDEAVNFYDAPFSTATAKSEVENNGFFLNATPFTVGNVLRGALASSGDIDLWKFSGSRGQTLYFKTDSATTNSVASINMRLTCASDTSTVNNYRFLAFDLDAIPSLVFTLPADGTYYLRLSFNSGTLPQYRIQTTFDTPSLGERARDHRDNFIAHSDGGAAWSTPLRLTDSAPWYDNEFPEVTVDGTGAVHCFWHDFRDDAGCGAESYEYLVSSGDGGASFGPNRRLSDARSFWSINACGSANQGDYQGITSEGNAVYPCWADSRLGDPDVWAERDLFQHDSGCPPNQTAPAGSSPTLSFTIHNTGNTDGTFGYSLSDGNGWLTASSGSGLVGPGGTQKVEVSLNVPANCSPQSDTVRFVTRDSNIPGRSDTCQTVVFCVSATAAPALPSASLFLALPAPNPSPRGARLRFGLSRDGPARLEIFAANGARLRTLVSGRQDAGEHAVLWDGRDQRGYRIHAGVYYALLEAEGRSLRRPVVIVP